MLGKLGNMNISANSVVAKQILLMWNLVTKVTAGVVEPVAAVVSELSAQPAGIICLLWEVEQVGN